jgi:Na+-driven multidrug efflux pump
MQNQFLGLESKPALQFFSFSVPAVLGMLLTSGIIIVDGLFIGNCIGRAGLASVNLTLPVIYLFMGVTIMISVGGSVKAGHALGAGMQDRAGQWFSLTTALAAGVVGALTTVYFIFFDPLINLLNADPGLHISLKTIAYPRAV